jgi:uncharacterized protein
MSRAYDIIDADSHVLEPLTMWSEYIDPAFRDRAPKVVIDNGERFLRVDEMSWNLGGSGLGRGGAIGARDEGIEEEFTYEMGRAGGFDPHARVVDMDLDKIDAAFLYPTIGLKMVSLEDAELTAKLCRALNRWLAEFCSAYPDRMFGVAMLPMQSVELARQELEFARTELNMRAGILRPNSAQALFHHPEWEPLWDAAEDLDIAIALHEGGARAATHEPGVERFFTSPGARHVISHTVEMEIASLSLLWHGVCDRHPKIRFGFMESGGGWIAGWLDRMDRHYEDKEMHDTGLSMAPSELFRRNCWISFEPVEQSLTPLADYLGPTKILWATDYPHSDGFFPGAPKLIQDRPLSPETKAGILAGGAMAFYGLS